MNKITFPILFLLLSVTLTLLFNKNISLKKENIKLYRELAHKEFKIKQLNFNLNYLDIVRNRLSINLNSNSKRYDTLMYYYFSDSACMYCVNFELANNIKDTPVRIIANISSEREYKNLTRSYNQFNITRDTIKTLKLKKPFYIIQIKDKVVKIFESDIKKNNYTKDFLREYGIRKLEQANN